MTIKELAKHWNVSFKKAKSISDFMNETFYMCIGQKKGDPTYYGVIYENFRDGATRIAFTLSKSEKKGFDTCEEAIAALNRVPERIRIPDLRAKLMDVPTDAYIALKKVPHIVATKGRTCPAPVVRSAFQNTLA